MMQSKKFAILVMLLSINLAPSPSAQCATPGSPDLLGGVEVVNWPAPAGEELFEGYTLRVSGQAVPVYRCRVSAMPFNQVWPGYQRPTDQTELAGFAYWGMSGPVRVDIVVSHPFQTVTIRPTSRGIQPTVQGQHITFQLSHPGQFTVELDGSHHALHLFADPPEVEVPRPGDPNVLYFGPGVYRLGKIQLQNGQTVYVAGGAVVYATIEGHGLSGVRILGRGIIDSSEFERGQFGGSIHLSDCSDVKIDGVILRDPPEWCLSAFGCRNLAISDVKIVGLWRYNTDGIDICNSQDVTIRDSFVRSFDDSIVLKGLQWKDEGYNQRRERNILATNLVVWCDWGRALEIGAETSAPEYSDIVFRNIDVIRNTHIAMDIQHGDRAVVHNIRYEDIRVEVDDFNPPPIIQETPNDKYNPNADFPVGACGGCATLPPNTRYVPNLLVIVVAHNGASEDREQGRVRNVIYKDISVTGKEMPPSAFTGLDAAHDVQGVTIENLRFNGHPISNAGEAHLQIGKYVQDVRFLASGNKP
jgi:hypothetical protein